LGHHRLAAGPAPYFRRRGLAGAGADRAAIARNRVRPARPYSPAGDCMNNRPYGNELLDVARRTLLDELLPLLPGEKAYEALMVANAMAIASRELAPHAADDRAARREIQRFLADIGQGDAVEPTEHALAAQVR